MNEIDYAALLVFVISVGIGVFRGAIHEVMNIVGWVAAFVLAYAYAGKLAPYFADWMSEPVYRSAIAWIVIFGCVLMFSSLIASVLTGVVQKLGLGSLDRVVGGAIGAGRAILILIALSLVAGLSKFPQTALWKNAATTPFLESVALYARAFLPESVAARISFRATQPAPAIPVRAS